MKVSLIPALKDNYIFLIEDESTRACAVVDPSESAPVWSEVQQRGLELTHIFLTHHHLDHVGGVQELKRLSSCSVSAGKQDQHRIGHVDQWLEDGDTIEWRSLQAKVLFLPGHTLGHIAYHFEDQKALFCGDTLFSVGCGRLFEGTPEQMQKSLSRLRALPDETTVYCAHEYTQANIEFAKSIRPDHRVLEDYEEICRSLRAQGIPTIPTRMGHEKSVNPFLMWDDETLRAHLNLKTASDTEVFAHVRRLKDQF